MASNFPSHYQGSHLSLRHQGAPFPPSRHQRDPNFQNTPWDVYWLKSVVFKTYNRDKHMQSLSRGACGGGVKGISLWSMGRGPDEFVVHRPRTSLLRHWVHWLNALTLKEPGFLDPSQPGGGGFRPPKISETDWRNIKCVVLVDSYDPPESIGTKKVQTYLVWRHGDVIRDVMSKTRKSPKIAKIMVFRYFSSKVAFFGNDVCQSILTHVLTPNKPNK